jgi:tRNA threonylcarbamoyl adenosine modification protein YeaZ
VSLLLCLDASTPAIGVGLYGQDGRELSSIVERGARGDCLPEAIRQILSNAGANPQDIGKVACGVGPGSFTGIRAALAAATGMAFRRDLELVGVSSLLAALAHPDLRDRTGVRLALLDAYREEAFLRRVPAGVPLSQDRGTDIRVLRCELAEHLEGVDTLLWHGRDAQGIPDTALDLADFLHPAGVAHLALAGNVVPAIPNYLREAAPVEALLEKQAKESQQALA